MTSFEDIPLEKDDIEYAPSTEDEIEKGQVAAQESAPPEAVSTAAFVKLSRRHKILATLSIILVVLAAIIVPKLVFVGNETNPPIYEKTEPSRPLNESSFPPLKRGKDGTFLTHTYDVTNTREKAVAAIARLHANLTFPDHLASMESYGSENFSEPVVRKGDFNVSSYWDVLDHISLVGSMTVEYVYFFDYMGGYPILYSRNLTDDPFHNVSEYREATQGLSYLHAVKVDNAPQKFHRTCCT